MLETPRRSTPQGRKLNSSMSVSRKQSHSRSATDMFPEVDNSFGGGVEAQEGQEHISEGEMLETPKVEHTMNT